LHPNTLTRLHLPTQHTNPAEPGLARHVDLFLSISFPSFSRFSFVLSAGCAVDSTFFTFFF
jgi:hypothetical protein